jgi:formylglycine-generating enzyme required for sulfatase activity
MAEIEQLQKELEEIKKVLASLTEGSVTHQIMTERQRTIEAELKGSGAIAQGNGAKAVGAGGALFEGDIHGDVIIQQPARNGPTPLPLDEALQSYLDNLIATHRHLKLQGIRAGSQPLSVALEKVYVSLTADDKRAGGGKQGKAEEMREMGGALTISAALRRYRRLVIIGDPGCGKTTLLSYLTLTYARAFRQGDDTVQARLSLEEGDHLPIFLPLRDLGQHLRRENPNPGMDGPALMLAYLRAYYLAQNICLPEDFFNAALESGKAVILLDGMDELADLALRQRTARLIEKFAGRYPKCRFVITSRVVGYDGAARVGAEFGLAKVRDFSPAEVRQFIRDWTRVVETTLAGSDSAEVLRLADEQSEKLIGAIDTNPRVAELAVNPLLLTVIALVHRYRAQLPERRSELYEEAIEVLLGHWDESKGMDKATEVAGITQKLDGGDRRSLLEPVALWMHEHKRREIERDELRPLLLPTFQNLAGTPALAAKALDDFLRVINERSGLLIERGTGVYGFAHLTFQEYLAARALADRVDALAFTLKVLPDPWWREVILLQAGYLSGQGKRRVSELIAAIMNADPKTEPEPHHHLLLAAECLFDVGSARVEGDLLGQARQRLQKYADAPLKKGEKAALLAKLAAMNALARIESGKITSQLWKQPWGEPEWVTIPAGEFWMGADDISEDEKPVHKLTLPEYQIARVPVTNAQYAIYVQDAKANPPEYWRGGNVPKGLENHPVVNVSWYDALAYCKWLGEKIDKPVGLPSEAEWEKAARGSQDKRSYPWGNDWRELHCNSSALGLGETTPVGLFLNGASSYGLLDMSGNVWEWTRSLYHPYPYEPGDGREKIYSEAEYNQNQQKDNKGNYIAYSLRGGAFDHGSVNVRCALRDWFSPDFRYGNRGFRVGLFFSRASQL